jgi:ribosomal protein L20A (L18A)
MFLTSESSTYSYSQEMPSRFKKEIVSAAKERNEEIILIEGLERVLHNIGASHKISRSEMEVIFNELGVSGYIPAERMVGLI